MKIDIHQIYYLKNQRDYLLPEFIPYDNSSSQAPDNFEYSVFISNFLKGNVKSDYTGFVSWKFKQKTNIDGNIFIRFIKDNPGYDVYFINPFPDQACFKNVWHQGDAFHPNLLSITKDLLKSAGYNIDIEKIENRIDTLCYCNYWVGTPSFWKRYIEFISPLYFYIKNNATPEQNNILNTKADKSINAPYHPFIFERLFSTFLSLNPDIKCRHYEYQPEYLKCKYKKTYKYIDILFQTNKNRQYLIYYFVRRLLYFRMYGHKKFPLIKKIFSYLYPRLSK